MWEIHLGQHQSFWSVRSSQEEEECIHILNLPERVEKECEKDRLKLNAKKTKYIIYNSPQRSTLRRKWDRTKKNIELLHQGSWVGETGKYVNMNISSLSLNVLAVNIRMRIRICVQTSIIWEWTIYLLSVEELSLLLHCFIF